MSDSAKINSVLIDLMDSIFIKNKTIPSMDEIKKRDKLLKKYIEGETIIEFKMKLSPDEIDELNKNLVLKGYNIETWEKSKTK